MEIGWAVYEQRGGTVRAAHNGESFGVAPDSAAGCSLADSALEGKILNLY